MTKNSNDVPVWLALLHLGVAICSVWLLVDIALYDNAPKDYFALNRPVADVESIDVEIYDNEFVIVAEGPWCPLAVDNAGLVKKPDVPCPAEGWPAGTYLLNRNGEFTKGSDVLATVTEEQLNCDALNLPSNVECQRNIKVTIEQEVSDTSRIDVITTPLSIDEQADLYFQGAYPPITFNDTQDLKYSQWEYIKYPNLYQSYLLRQRMTVAVLDTGVSPHSELRLIEGASFVKGKGTTDRNGHGTHVAGSCCAMSDNDEGIVSPGNGIRVLPIKVLGDDGSGSTYSVMSGIDYAVEWQKNNPHTKLVVNMSLGAYGASIMCKGMMRLQKVGVIAVVAAGNESKSLNTYKSYPAYCKEENVIVVGAINKKGERADFSNFGERVDVYAPGHRILSLTPDGGYEFMSGTSMASPFVAGVVAGLLSESPNMHPVVIRKYIADGLRGEKIFGCPGEAGC